MTSESIQFVPTVFAGFGELMGIHRHLLDDHLRTSMFVRAVKETVKAGDCVIDLGTGTGILALTAVRAGASRVYAVEYGSIIRVAQELAERNDGQRIVFAACDASSFQPPELADVLVSECLGLMGAGGTMIPIVAAMARRGLRPGGRVIPRRFQIYLTPVETPGAFAYVQRWNQVEYGLDFSSLQRLASNNLYIAALSEDNLIAEPQRIADFDFLGSDLGTVFEAEMIFRPDRPARLHGLSGWFDAELTDSLFLRTGPSQPPTIWRQTFLPLERELAVSADSEIKVFFRIRRGNDSLPIIFDWQTETTDASGEKHRFSQSTAASFP
jgi:protein arginine N-methyltransferase 1